MAGLLAAFVNMQACLAVSSPVEADSTPERREADILKRMQTEPSAEPYISSIVNKLFSNSAELNGLTPKVHAVGSNYPSVYYTGNGIAFVSIGLLARLQNDSQVAAIIAIEIAAYEYGGRNSAREERKHTDKTKGTSQQELDRRLAAIVLQWMLRAGFDPAQAPAALRKLSDALEEEYPSSDHKSADYQDVRIAIRLTALKSQTESFDAALSGIAGTGSPKQSADAKSEFPALAHKYALHFAQLAAINGKEAEFNLWVNRLDRESGISTATICLRAKYLQATNTNMDNKETQIDAFKRCTSQPDAPATAFRELGLLYQEQHANQDASNAFSEYLKRSPDAVDKPIVLGYLENLREHH